MALDFLNQIMRPTASGDTDLFTKRLMEKTQIDPTLGTTQGMQTPEQYMATGEPEIVEQDPNTAMGILFALGSGLMAAGGMNPNLAAHEALRQRRGEFAQAQADKRYAVRAGAARESIRRGDRVEDKREARDLFDRKVDLGKEAATLEHEREKEIRRLADEAAMERLLASQKDPKAEKAMDALWLEFGNAALGLLNAPDFDGSTESLKGVERQIEQMITLRNITPANAALMREKLKAVLDPLYAEAAAAEAEKGTRTGQSFYNPTGMEAQIMQDYAPPIQSITNMPLPAMVGSLGGIGWEGIKKLLSGDSPRNYEPYTDVPRPE